MSKLVALDRSNAIYKDRELFGRIFWMITLTKKIVSEHMLCNQGKGQTSVRTVKNVRL